VISEVFLLAHIKMFWVAQDWEDFSKEGKPMVKACLGVVVQP